MEFNAYMTRYRVLETDVFVERVKRWHCNDIFDRNKTRYSFASFICVSPLTTSATSAMTIEKRYPKAFLDAWLFWRDVWKQQDFKPPVHFGERPVFLLLADVFQPFFGKDVGENCFLLRFRTTSAFWKQTKVLFLCFCGFFLNWCGSSIQRFGPKGLSEIRAKSYLQPGHSTMYT